jgi:hypothetical protein
VTELENTIAVLDRSFRSSSSIVTAALPGLGGASAASIPRSDCSAPGSPMTDATGRMLVEAIRSVTEILAAAVRMLLSRISEAYDEQHGVDFTPWSDQDPGLFSPALPAAESDDAMEVAESEVLLLGGGA